MITHSMNIDWELLRQQKLSLSVAIDRFLEKKELLEAEHLTGILHMLDALQDRAVDEGHYTEAEVFGEPEKEE